MTRHALWTRGRDAGTTALSPVTDDPTGRPLMSSPQVTMYTTSWCGYCVRLKRHLNNEGIVFAEVNIETDPAAAEFVMNVNGGNRTVPTVLFPDGTALTNPTPAQIREHVA